MPNLICPICQSAFTRDAYYVAKAIGELCCSRKCRFALKKRLYEQLTEKTCSACETTKPIGEFPIGDLICRVCKNRKQREYVRQNAEKVKQGKALYYEQNQQKIAAYRKRRYQENKDRILRQVAEYREKNRESIKLWMRQYRKDNPDTHKKTHLKSVTKNRDRIRDRNRERGKRPDVLRLKINSNRLRKIRKQNLPNTLTYSDWEHTLSHFGGCCAVCGRPPGLWHRIAMDHWIPLSSPNCPGTTPSNVVPLCHGVDGCNNKKLSKHPHQWLTEFLGGKKAKAILKRIEDFLASSE